MYIEHLRLPVGPGSVHVERLGRGRTAVLLVHGFGTNAALWRPVSRRLAEAGFLTLAVDLLGHGESDRPVDASYDLASQADALERVMAALRVERAIVVGQDVGALVALAFAARHPTLAEQLVLLNPPDPSDLPPAPVRLMQRSAARVALSTVGHQLGATALIAALLADATGDPAQLPQRDMARYLAPWVGAGGVEQLLVLARTLEQESVPLASLASIETPTLIVRGTADRSVPPTIAAALAGTLPNARLETIVGAGRLLASDVPERLSALIHAPVELSAFPAART
jgi:pimeloyl-ACP methyl ester carboxylesterase